MGGLAASQVIDHIVDKIQQFIDECTGVDLFFFPEVDKMAVDAIAACPPFILVYKGAGILDIVHIQQAQLVDLYTDRLEEGGDTDGLVHGHRHVADAELHRIEEWMDAEIPPD